MSKHQIDNIIFDLGGVLIDWNPRHLYKKIFKGDEEQMEWFLSHICTNEWNMEQDAGRSLQKGTDLLVKQYPEYAEGITAYYQRWEEMLYGEIKDTVLILNLLHSLNKKKLYALTNWSAETFPVAMRRFPFLKLFEGIVVSGTEMCRKPYEKIYNILLDRYEIKAENSLFIDDNKENVDAALQLGFHAVHFKSPQLLKAELMKLQLLY
jgi:2-haloacid dehalogenase